MQSILDFMGTHWFLTWCLSWLLWGVFAVILAPRRLIRALVICVRGWPPAHLDADGDWNPAPEDDA